MDSISSASKSLMEFMSMPSLARRNEVEEHPRRMLEVSGVALTVPYVVKLGVYAAEEVDALERVVMDTVVRVFDEAEQRFSPFLATSELEQINKARHTDHIVVSDAMSEVLKVCGDLVEWTDGLFDPTCVPAGRWAVAEVRRLLSSSHGANFGDANHSSWFPPAACNDGSGASELSKAVEKVVACTSFCDLVSHIGWSKNIILGPGWVRKRDPLTELDVSAVSKGWTVDLLFTRLMQECSLLDVYVDWGGDVRCLGTAPETEGHRPWMSGLLTPPSGGGATPSEVATCLELPASGASLCTSGDYYQWSHMIDAVSLAPPTVPPSSPQPTSVSLMVEGLPCALCDGLSTALFLMLRRLPLSDVVSRFCGGLPRRDDTPMAYALVVMMRTSDGRLERVDVKEHAHRPLKSPDHLSTGLHSPLQRCLHKSSLVGVPVGMSRRSNLLDSNALRSIFQRVPRSLHLLLLPTTSPQVDLRKGLFPQKKFYACVVSSLVQVSSSSVVILLERPSAAAALLDRLCALSPESPPSFSVGYVAPELLRRTAEGGTGLLEATRSGMFVDPSDDVILDAFHVCTYRVKMPVCTVGDHALLQGTWDPLGWKYCRQGAVHSEGFHPNEYNTSNAGTPSCGLLLRVGKRYLSVAVPQPIERWQRLPRARCVATVCIGCTHTGKVDECLGTVLAAPDVASRQPLLLTAYARAGVLHDRLFAHPTSTVSPTSVTLVRMHMFAHGDADGEALVHWFGDVTCVDAAVQFMYHQTPLRTMTKLAGGAPGSPGEWTHAYRFGGAAPLATIDCSLVDVIPQHSSEGGHGYIVVLRPVQCDATRMDGVGPASYGFL